MISANVFLEGPYDPLSGLMRDDLREAGLLPVTEPYTALSYTAAPNSVAGNDVVAASVLQVIGPDAIVDWVVLELRAGFSGLVPASTRYALLQRDGDIVETDGVSPVRFPLSLGNYRLSVLHRNHLGIVESEGVLHNGTYYENSIRDLSAASFETEFGTDTRRQIGGKWVLRAGDTTFNDDVRYIGSGNDRDPILVRVGGSVPTNTVTGYFLEDVNMDGIVKYTGAQNDRDPVLVTVGGSTPTNIRANAYLHPTP